LVGDVVAGRFHEELHIPLFGRSRVHWWFGDIARAGHLRSGGQDMSRDRARILDTGALRRMHWQPWPRRGQTMVRPAAV
jgi:hypothetical protein